MLSYAIRNLQLRKIYLENWLFREANMIRLPDSLWGHTRDAGIKKCFPT
jgi:hypothetical protein